MKAILAFSAVLLAAPALGQSQPDSRANLQTGGATGIRGGPHDPWDVDAASPNRNISDSIGSTWKGGTNTPGCSNKDWACQSKHETAGQRKK